MTPDDLRTVIGSCEAAGVMGAVIGMDRPRSLYNAAAIEIAPLVYGRLVSESGNQVVVAIDLPSLRRLLALVEIADAPPQGSV